MTNSAHASSLDGSFARINRECRVSHSSLTPRSNYQKQTTPCLSESHAQMRWSVHFPALQKLDHNQQYEMKIKPVSKKEKEKAISKKQKKTNPMGSILARIPTGKYIKLCQDDKKRMVRVGGYI